jgi:hypothetical protein
MSVPKRYQVVQIIKDLRSGASRMIRHPQVYKSRTWAEKAAQSKRWATTPPPELKPIQSSDAEVVEVSA